jgi:hypothetical protein
LHTTLKPSSISAKFGSKCSHTLDLLTRVGVESSELSEVFVEVLADMQDNIKHTGRTILIYQEMDTQPINYIAATVEVRLVEELDSLQIQANIANIV